MGPIETTYFSFLNFSNTTSGFDIYTLEMSSTTAPPIRNSSELALETEKVQDTIYLLLYSLTCAMAMFGNYVVCKVVFGKPSMMTFTNLLLANMAISDMLCALMFVLGLMVCCDRFIGSAGNYVCVTAKAIQLTSFQVSSVTMTVVAIDRFMLVHYPIIRSHRIVPAWVVMLCVWVLSMLIIVGTSPSLAFHRYFTERDAYIKCEVVMVFSDHVLSAKEQRIRLVIANLAHFWIPLLVIIVCYGKISWKVSSRNVGHVTPSQQDIILRTKWKTIKMLIAAVVVFFICWFPFFILNLLDFFGNPQRKRPCNKSGLFFIAVWIAFTSCCCNPFVYWIYSEDFRDGLMEIARLARSSIASRPSIISYISSFKDMTGPSKRKNSQPTQEEPGNPEPNGPNDRSDHLISLDSRNSCIYIGRTNLRLNIMATASASTLEYDDEAPSTYVTELNLLMKVQTAGKNWDKAPDELLKLHDLFMNGDFEISWNPQKFGINLLTANKVRGIVLKRVLMKLYPFEQFWITDTLDETLHKCLLVCQQLGIDAGKNVVWGQCPMDTSYLFWIHVLKKIPRSRKNKGEENRIQDAKSKVIAALIATRGTDWDKRIARNFEDALGKNRLAPFLLKTISSHEASLKARSKSPFKMSNENWRSSFQNVFDPNRNEANLNPDQLHSTSSFAITLRQESQEMIDILHNLEKHYNEDCVLQIDKAFELGDKVGKLVEDFDSYMGANNRGAFRDVEALTNHTDKVIKFLSKLTTAYLDFFMEFQKYCRNGRGDELIMTRSLIYAADLNEKGT